MLDVFLESMFYGLLVIMIVALFALLGMFAYDRPWLLAFYIGVPAVGFIVRYFVNKNNF